MRGSVSGPVCYVEYYLLVVTTAGHATALWADCGDQTNVSSWIRAPIWTGEGTVAGDPCSIVVDSVSDVNQCVFRYGGKWFA